ncbi:photosystem I assembly BtpA [Candidatus Izimaplasma bacterium ZiA1]|uniref:BtpA/SgcQ family protein n=1 Tax=Candidatus Izimoplasma sp. ZiA1 TaxID=2024899 RepID=UPI000BAA6AFD|nr:photosystem I assembly BtpA [Candidatus Izimaplasma bacterium ZiA1]
MELLNKEQGPIIGMVHCLPLLMTPNSSKDIDKVASQAVSDAITLEKAGVDAIIVENMGDGPLGVKLDFEQSIHLSAVTALVKKSVNIPIGIDAAFNDYKTALSIAKVVGADFIRIPVFVDTVVGHLGVVKPCAREAMYYRKMIDAKDVKIFGDIQVKHSRMLLKDIPITESAHLAEAMGADAIIVTGVSTGFETPIDVIQKVKESVKIPVIAGSGIDTSNVNVQMKLVDGAIVGSSLKENKDLKNPISYDLTRALIKAYRGE